MPKAHCEIKATHVRQNVSEPHNTSPCHVMSREENTSQALVMKQCAANTKQHQRRISLGCFSTIVAFFNHAHPRRIPTRDSLLGKNDENSSTSPTRKPVQKRLPTKHSNSCYIAALMSVYMRSPTALRRVKKATTSETAILILNINRMNATRTSW